MDHSRFNNLIKELKDFQNQPSPTYDITDPVFLNLELERELLEQIQSYDEKVRGASLTSVYDFIGKPQFAEDPGERTSYELNRLKKLLNEYNIFPDSVYPVTDHEFYKFLVRDVFKQRIENVKVKLIKHEFTYEDFYPNHIKDINRYTCEFFESLFEFDQEFCTLLVFNEVSSRNGEIINEKLVRYLLINWMDGFNDIILRDLNLRTTFIDGDIAIQDFYINYYGFDSFSGKRRSYKGNGRLQFVFKYGFWYINKIDFPGIEI